MAKAYKKSKRWLAWLGTALIVAGLLWLFYPYLTDLYTYFRQSQAKTEWNKKRIAEKKKLKKSTEKIGKETKNLAEKAYYSNLKEGDPFARIVIPKIGLDVIVLEGTDAETLRRGPGHIKGFGLPGKSNLAISGHRVTYGHPFRRLDELEKGDPIYIYTPFNVYKYVVVEKKSVKPTEVSVIEDKGDIRLTLTTCHPPHSARERLIVVAMLKK